MTHYLPRRLWLKVIQSVNFSQICAAASHAGGACSSRLAIGRNRRQSGRWRRHAPLTRARRRIAQSLPDRVLRWFFKE